MFTTLTNLLAGPIIGFVIMPFVLAALLLMPLGLDYWPLKLVGAGIDLVNRITSYVAGLPEAAYQVMSMPLWGLLLIVYGALWVCIWQRKWRGLGFVLIAAGLMSIWTVKVPDVMANADGEVFAWIDMACDERSCLYKKRIRIIKYGGLEIDGKDYDLSSALGSNFYIDGKNVTVKTVRGAIGRRLWNN